MQTPYEHPTGGKWLVTYVMERQRGRQWNPSTIRARNRADLIAHVELGIEIKNAHALNKIVSYTATAIEGTAEDIGEDKRWKIHLVNAGRWYSPIEVMAISKAEATEHAEVFKAQYRKTNRWVTGFEVTPAT